MKTLRHRGYKFSQVSLSWLSSSAGFHPRHFYHYAINKSCNALKLFISFFPPYNFSLYPYMKAKTYLSCGKNTQSCLTLSSLNVPAAIGREDDFSFGTGYEPLDYFWDPNSWISTFS